MGKRARIIRVTGIKSTVIKPIKTLAEQFEVSYSAALRAYQEAKEIADDRSVLERCISILHLRNEIQKFKENRSKIVS